MSFSGNLQLDFGDWGNAGRIAITLGPVTWINVEGNPVVLVTIPVGYMSDGASVPRLFWWFLPPWGDRSTFAALIHDYLLDRLQGFEPGGPVTGCELRKQCDDQYLAASIALKVPKWRAYLAYLGVRAHSLILSLTGATDKPIGDQT